MRSLFVNPAWDAAGASWQLAQAINKYTNWDTRHFRVQATLGFSSDLVSEAYNRDEFVAILDEADVVHFCSAIHDYVSIDWGFDWIEKLKGKTKIFHDFCSFLGHWEERAKAKDLWTKCTDINYDAIFSSVPQAVYIYDGCFYIPDVVDIYSEEFKPVPWEFNQVIIGHFPTGEKNNKNTIELKQAIANVQREIRVGFVTVPSSSLVHSDCLRLKKATNLGFDALWRGYHGMTTVENLAMGIPTMVHLDPAFYPVFKEFFGTDLEPFENVNGIPEIISTIENYAHDLNILKARSIEVRAFIEKVWNPEVIAKRCVEQYEKLLEL
ncbi:MAG: hypothetical protein KAX49_17820 [Halanaerobiales bacterium]|nr:hypothetical protein [Halanaerobiales bacterium]